MWGAMSNVLSREDVEPIIRRLLCQASNQRVEAVLSEHQLRDLGIDSLGRHAVSVVLEAELDVSLDPDRLETLFVDGNGEDLVAYVLALQSRRRIEGERT